MGLLLLLVLCTLAVSCTTRSVPLEVPSHLLFRLRGCNDADMLAMVVSVLQDINNDLKEGYVLSLNRDGLGSLFYFTLDVLYTTCHVLSKKPWRDCEERHLHEQVSVCIPGTLGEKQGVLCLQGEDCSLCAIFYF
ncbi:Fetuin-B [Myotis brandtii]|uniref:Fetuin-B n=1 Tax=Myotis brandtii TaxID=109478 RepID=S7NUC3_MYOBR|nr:Fetuin-B [Myotis brandtii]